MLRLLLLVHGWVVLVELCRLIKELQSFSLTWRGGGEEEQSLGNQAELQQGLLQPGREMKSEVLELLRDQNVCS